MKYCTVILLWLAHEGKFYKLHRHQHSTHMNLHISLTSPRIWLGLQEATTPNHDKPFDAGSIHTLHCKVGWTS